MGLLKKLFGASSTSGQPTTKPEEKPEVKSEERTNSVKWPKETIVFMLGVHSKMDEYKVRYSYKDIDAIFVSNKYNPGDSLELLGDGQILCAGEVIGTFKSDKIRSMVEDWNRRGEPIVAKLLRMNEDCTGIVYAAFYKIPVYNNERLCKVSGTGSDKKQEELFLMNIGDELYLEEDYEHPGRVNVSDIGYLGKKDSEWAIEEINMNWSEVTVYSLDENDSGKTVLTIKIRY